MDELYHGNENNLLGRFMSSMKNEESDEAEEIRQKALEYGIGALLGVGDR